MDQQNDGQLLADVAAHSSQASFEEVVRRHGAMVYHECRRMLADVHDAEDAAQAVFLVLWKKAASLRKEPSVAVWLHRVARNICRNAQRARNVRKLHERRAAEVIRQSSTGGDSPSEIQGLLDESIDSLSERYRLPIILFHLEGRSIEEIAAMMNLNASTVTTRLCRGRELLRARMMRRGIEVSGAALAAAMGLNAGASALPADFFATTAQSAGSFAAGSISAGGTLATQAALANGVLRMLAIAQIKLAAATVVAVLAAGGATVAIVAASLAGETPAQLEAPPSVPLDGASLIAQVETPAPADGKATAGAIVPPSDETRKQLQKITEGYRANKAAFTFGKCRFTYSIHTADTEQDALKSKWNQREKPHAVECQLCFRDDLFTLTMKSDDEQPPGIYMMNAIKKGGYGIEQRGISCVVTSPENKTNRLNVRIHPFNLAVDSDFFDPASAISLAEEHNYDRSNFVLQEHVRRDGNDFLQLTKKSTGDSHNTTWFIDPRRGHLPFITEWFFKKTGEFESRMFLLDVHQEKSAYFPMHAMWIAPRAVQDGTSFVGVREMKVLELELKQPPTDEDLTVEFPRNAQYSDGVHANTAITLFRTGEGEFQRVSVHEIEGIYNQLLKVAAERVKPQIAGCARMAFGWLVPSYDHMSRGRIRFGQFIGQTELGQCFHLAANSDVQKELGLSQAQSDELASLIKAAVAATMGEAERNKLRFVEVEELQYLPLEARSKRIRELNGLMLEAERRFVEKFGAELKQLLSNVQFARLREIRRQLAGSRILIEPETIQLLSLTQQQQDQIAAINNQHVETMIDFFSSEFDTGNGDYKELMTKVEKMTKSRDEKALAVLTQPQQEQLAQYRGKVFNTSETRVIMRTLKSK